MSMMDEDWKDILVVLAEKVKREKISIDMSITADGLNLTISPWQPYTPLCPYAGKRVCSEEDDGK